MQLSGMGPGASVFCCTFSRTKSRVQHGTESRVQQKVRLNTQKYGLEVKKSDAQVWCVNTFHIL
jgi:hypothetical protein